MTDLTNVSNAAACLLTASAGPANLKNQAAPECGTMAATIQSGRAIAAAVLASVEGPSLGT